MKLDQRFDSNRRYTISSSRSSIQIGITQFQVVATDYTTFRSLNSIQIGITQFQVVVIQLNRRYTISDSRNSIGVRTIEFLLA